MRLFGQTFWGPFSAFGAGVALLSFLGDRVHKWWSLHVLDLPTVGRIRISDHFDIVMAWNKGVSYGLFQAETTAGIIFLVVFALAIVVGLGLWLAKAENKVLAMAIGLIIGGALGNVLDRLIYGAVADFFSFHAFGFYWYIFNVADIWIAVGVGLILIESFFPNLLGQVKPVAGHKNDSE
ncbi:MAG: signal peptidase II [Pseudomonadota bacterium]